MKMLVAAAALGAVLAVPAGAADIYRATFGKPDKGEVCYARLYDAAHLKAHPRQTVGGIAVDFSTVNDDSRVNSAAAFELALSVRKGKDGGWFAASPTCKTVAGHFLCTLSGDNGAFTLTPASGGLAFAVVPHAGSGDAIRLEGGDTGIGFGKPRGDDLVFALARAKPEVCDGGG
jgi:hypothetical protein